MSGGQDSDGERPHEASERKLDEARKRGELPRTAEVTGAVAMAGFLSLALMPGGWIAPRLGETGRALLDRADTAGVLLLGDGAAAERALYGAIGQALAPAALIPGVLVLAALFALRGIVFAPQKLAPKWSRVSPLSNAKNKFGVSGLVEFAKSSAKLVIFCVVLWLFLYARLPLILQSVAMEAGQVTAALGSLMLEFLALVVLIMLSVGGLDYIWQRFDHRRRQRMTHQELREEHKDSEGDPHMRQQRQQRATEIASNRMLADVPSATVIVVNPTHYAVALRWSPTMPGAPVCVAKGTDEIALKIREIAQEHNIPIHSDPPTARALHATVRLGQEIAPDHYRAVAAAIRFAEDMRRRARGQARPAPPPGDRR